MTLTPTGTATPMAGQPQSVRDIRRYDAHTASVSPGRAEVARDLLTGSCLLAVGPEAVGVNISSAMVSKVVAASSPLPLAHEGVRGDDEQHHLATATPHLADAPTAPTASRTHTRHEYMVTGVPSGLP